MKNIYSRTLETTVTKPLIVLSVLIAILGEILTESFGPNSYSGDYYSVISQSLLAQHTVMFLLICGAWLMIMVISTSTGLISSEVHEGTFRLLVAKPNTRKQILLAKIAGAFTGQVILLLLTIFVYYGALFFNAKMSAEIYKQMIHYMPGYILYGITVIIIFLGLSTLLSCIFRKKITAMLPLIAVVVIMIAFFPIQRLISGLSGKSLSALISLVDVNYHFGLIFKFYMNMFGGIYGKTERLEILAYLTNMFSSTRVDKDFIRESYSSSYVTDNNTLNMYAVTLTYLILSALIYVGSFAIIKKKDV